MLLEDNLNIQINKSDLIDESILKKANILLSNHKLHELKDLFDNPLHSNILQLLKGNVKLIDSLIERQCQTIDYDIAFNNTVAPVLLGKPPLTIADITLPYRFFAKSEEIP